MAEANKIIKDCY